MNNPKATGQELKRPPRVPGGGRTRVIRRTIILAASAVVVIAAIAGIAIYNERVRPLRTTVLEVDGTKIPMGYLIKRLAMSGGQAVSVLHTLTEEQIVKETAVKPPFSLTASPQEIDQFVRAVAQGSGSPLGEAEFKAWYRQQLNESRLSDSEYKEFLRIKLLSVKMNEYLGARTPTTAEQIFLNMILVSDSTVGAEVKKKFDAGTGFAALVQQYSTSPELKAKGGKVGWFPQGVLDSRLDGTAFQLAPGECSDPISIDEHTTALIMISAKSPLREIDEQSLKVLKSRALEDWYQTEYPKHTVKYHGFHGGYDSETDAWVQQQLSRMHPRQQENTGTP